VKGKRESYFLCCGTVVIRRHFHNPQILKRFILTLEVQDTDVKWWLQDFEQDCCWDDDIKEVLWYLAYGQSLPS